MTRLAAKLQDFCRQVQGDERLANLKRGRSRSDPNFADLTPKKAVASIRKAGSVIALNNIGPGNEYVGLHIAPGFASVMAGAIRLTADNSFWSDEACIRRVTEALIDFWQPDQACIYTLTLPPEEWQDRHPWYFWLDWRRTRDQPTLMPHVRMFGEPSIEREWHGGVERLWPEHEPWRHVGVLGTA